MKRFLKTQAVVIRCEDFGEADRLVTLLSGHYGLIRAIVKGARKIKSKLASGTQFLSIGYYNLYHGRTFYTVTQCEAVRVFKNIFGDINKFMYASVIAELASYIATEGEDSYSLYKLVLKILYELDDCEGNFENYIIYFMLEALKIAGFRPEVDVCVRCRVPISAPVYFSISDGGIICPDCTHNKSHIYRINPEVAAALKYMLTADIKGVKSLDLSRSSRHQIKKLLAAFISYHFEKEIRSLQFVEKESV